jgi:hypothetical protein
MNARSTLIIVVLGCVASGGVNASAADQARRPSKPASIGPAQLPPIEKKASRGDEAPQPAPAKPAPRTSAAKPAPAKPSGKSAAEKPAPSAVAQLDALQSTRLEGCLTVAYSGGWMLTTLSDRRQIALVGDEDIPHHVGELVQVKGAFIGSTNIAQQKAPPPSKDTFDVDVIVVLAPSCLTAVK